MREHMGTRKIGPGDYFENKVAHPDSTSADRRNQERAKIERHRPTANELRGGGGRPPKE